MNTLVASVVAASVVSSDEEQEEAEPTLIRIRVKSDILNGIKFDRN